jgi:hypothetical protein
MIQLLHPLHRLVANLLPLGAAVIHDVNEALPEVLDPFT